MRLVDADALEPKFVHGRWDDTYVSNSELINAPTIEERKRGRWISDLAFYDEDGCPCIVLRCSECGEAYPKSNFCPNCGADMRGENNG